MDLVRLIYASRMTEDCDIKAIQDILEVARTHNKTKDITGVLFYDALQFMQCLEGPRQDVNELYRNILNDRRHQNVQLLEYCEPKGRLFADWSMGFLAASEVKREVLEKHLGTGKFDPYKFSADQAVDFLVEMVARNRDSLTS